MSRKLFTLFIALVCFTTSANILADEAAEIEKIKDVLNSEEEALWAGDVGKLKSLYVPDIVMITTNAQVRYDSDDNELIDPLHYDFWGSGSDWFESYAELSRSKPDYLKKYPDFGHMIVIESVKVTDDAAIAVVKYIRWWTRENPRQATRQSHRNVWILKKVEDDWKLSCCISYFASGWRTFNRRPPQE